ncbi:TetR/AcrR family transcriptional regulator [Streptomyces umbrinus]|uniref:TetR/AcrR family transcriptional regulator n=1 Tax=Streptomyces umbrinus TaxID=67370 RepID=UPI0016765D93|nr:TetR/AcrR family transcriptional regulator [Streptomyces umbrinus]GHB91392.1 TetR family transcriptional regulator [Streptomyces umbrinus]
MTARSQPLSRRERPAKPALTRAGIISSAVRIMRAEGLQRVTMRRLAKELDTGPASLYVYVANTAELHAAILDELLGEVDLESAAASGDWRERIEAVLTSYSRLLHQHPSLAQAALVARPSGPNYLNLLEALLALLSEGGVPDGQAAWGVDVLLQVATASAAEHAGRDDAPGSGEEWNAVAAAVENASAAEVPHIAALGSDLLSGTPQTRQTWGVQMLLNGILHTPRATP